jgi:hypothetical protein
MQLIRKDPFKSASKNQKNASIMMKNHFYERGADILLGSSYKGQDMSKQ